MANRTAYAGTASSGDTYTAANHAKMPGGWIGHVDVTVAPVAAVSAETDIGLFTVTVTVNTARRIKVSIQTHVVRSVADGLTALYIKEGSTYHTSIFIRPASTVAEVVSGAVILTPTAGSHTYKVAQQRFSGTGTTNIECSAAAPSFILVEDMGPAS